MSDGFDDILRGLEQLGRDTERRALRGLTQAAAAATGDLQATDAHGDITGATRASYVAYAATAQDPNDAAHAAARDAAADLNPDFVAHETIESPPDGVVRVVETAATTYEADLETDNGGQKATIGPQSIAHAPQFFSAAMKEIGDGLR